MPTVSGPKQGGSSAYQAPSWAPQPQNQRPNTFGARPQSYRRPIRQHRSFPDRGPDSLRPDFLQRLGRRGYANYWFDGPGQGGALSHYLEQQQRRRGIGVGEPLRHPLGQRPEASPSLPWARPRSPDRSRKPHRLRVGFAGGGYVEPKGYAGGGPAQGTDTEPAMLTPGEFVVSRPAVQKIGINNLLAMNAAGGGTNRPTLGPGGIYAKGGGPVRPSRKKKPKKKPFQGANNNFILDLATDYQDKLDASNAANEARYEQLLAGYDDLSGSVLGQLGDSIGESRDIHGNIIGGWGDIEQGFRAGYGGLHQRIMERLDADALANEEKYGNILGQYGTMRDRILGGFTSQGQDQIAESRKAYDESLAATNAAMATRGMAGTTIGGSMKQRTDRGYQDAVRGIQESVLRRKTAADMGISQAQLSQEANFQRAREAAQARRLQADMGISQNAMQAIAQAQQGSLGGQQNMASQLANQQAQRANMEATLQKGKFGVIERREDTGPDFNQLMGLVQGAASTGYGQGYGGGYGTSPGGSGGVFSMNDYLGGRANPYEAVAAGLLGHTAKPKPGAAKP